MKLEPRVSAAVSTNAIPTDVRFASARRLVGFAWLATGLWALYQLLYNTIWSSDAILELQFSSFAMLGVSAFVAIYVGRGNCSPRSVIVTGFAFLAVSCLVIGFGEFFGMRHTMPSNQASWAAIVIVFFPLLIATSSRATAIGSFVAASMGPLAYALAALAKPELLELPASVVVSYLLPNYLAAGMAVFAAHVVHGLARDIRDARRLGSYELVELLGEGGMGQVWRARHRLLARPAAIKLIRAELSSGDATERFEREAQTTASLESPHTVELYDFGISDDGDFYYVMELLRGVDLETLVRDHGPQPAERVIHLLLQVCDSLDDAHRAGLVHRDIKPANIFLARRSNRVDFVKVLDFGLVKTMASENLGATGDRIVGTPAYMAPELAAKPNVDARVDIYAVGCVGYWLLTGELVFSGDTAMAMAIAHATAAPEPPSQRTDNPIPAALERIILSCLAKEPSERPQTASELAQELAAIPQDPPWSNDRASRWWGQHLAGESSTSSEPSVSEVPSRYLRPVG